jgi:hypothetical protein
VRLGADHYHAPSHETGAASHTLPAVYAEMLRQICRDYGGGIPDFRELTLSDIRFFYEGLRGELQAITKPR